MNQACQSAKSGLIQSSIASKVTYPPAEEKMPLPNPSGRPSEGSSTYSAPGVWGQALPFACSARAMRRLTRETDSPNSRAIALMVIAPSVWAL